MENENKVEILNDNEVEKVAGGDRQIVEKLKDEILKHGPYIEKCEKVPYKHKCIYCGKIVVKYYPKGMIPNLAYICDECKAKKDKGMEMHRKILLPEKQ